MKYKFALTLSLLATCVLHAADPQIVEIHLASDPTKALVGGKAKAVEVSSSHASKFKMLPGLTNSQLSSFELVGTRNYYLRHQKFILHFHERPKLNPGFNDDATFKVVHLDGDKVRFAASNFPNHFITTTDAGEVFLRPNPAPEQSTFVLKK